MLQDPLIGWKEETPSISIFYPFRLQRVGTRHLGFPNFRILAASAPVTVLNAISVTVITIYCTNRHKDSVGWQAVVLK